MLMDKYLIGHFFFEKSSSRRAAKKMPSKTQNGDQNLIYPSQTATFFPFKRVLKNVKNAAELRAKTGCLEDHIGLHGSMRLRWSMVWARNQNAR